MVLVPTPRVCRCESSADQTPRRPLLPQVDGAVLYAHQLGVMVR